MAIGKAVRYGVVGAVTLVVAYVLASLLVGIVSAALSVLWWTFSLTLTLLVLGGLAYGGYRLGSWLAGTGPGTGSASSGRSDDPLDRLQQQYVDGVLDEAEFERELDRILDDGPDRTRDPEFETSGSR